MGVVDSQRTTYSNSDRSTSVDESSALLTARQRRRRRSAVEADYEIKSLQYPVKKTFPERLKGRLVTLGAIVVLLVLVALCNPSGERHGGHPHELLRVALADEHATATTPSTPGGAHDDAPSTTPAPAARIGRLTTGTRFATRLQIVVQALTLEELLDTTHSKGTGQ